MKAMRKNFAVSESIIGNRIQERSLNKETEIEILTKK